MRSGHACYHLTYGKTEGTIKDRLKAYIKENEVRLDSLTRQLKHAQKQVATLREELQGAERKRAKNEQTIRRLNEENLFLSKQLELREKGMVTEASEEQLVELYKQRNATEALSRHSAKKVLADLEKARGIILRPSEREDGGETPQVQPQPEGGITGEQKRKRRQEQKEQWDNEAVSEAQRERPENGFIDEKNPQQRKAGELTLRERRFKEGSGGGSQRR